MEIRYYANLSLGSATNKTINVTVHYIPTLNELNQFAKQEKYSSATNLIETVCPEALKTIEDCNDIEEIIHCICIDCKLNEELTSFLLLKHRAEFDTKLIESFDTNIEIR